MSLANTFSTTNEARRHTMRDLAWIQKEISITMKILINNVSSQTLFPGQPYRLLAHGGDGDSGTPSTELSTNQLLNSHLSQKLYTK